MKARFLKVINPRNSWYCLFWIITFSACTDIDKKNFNGRAFLNISDNPNSERVLMLFASDSVKFISSLGSEISMGYSYSDQGLTMTDVDFNTVKHKILGKGDTIVSALSGNQYVAVDILDLDDGGSSPSCDLYFNEEWNLSTTERNFRYNFFPGNIVALYKPEFAVKSPPYFVEWMTMRSYDLSILFADGFVFFLEEGLGTDKISGRVWVRGSLEFFNLEKISTQPLELVPEVYVEYRSKDDCCSRCANRIKITEEDCYLGYDYFEQDLGPYSYRVSPQCGYLFIHDQDGIKYGVQMFDLQDGEIIMRNIWSIGSGSILDSCRYVLDVLR